MLHKRLIKPHLQFTVLFTIFCFIPSCFGTSVFVLVVPSGIVAAADGQVGTLPPCGISATTGPTKHSTLLKIFLLPRGIIVSNINLDRMISRDNAVLYDFPSWIKGINQKLGPEASVSAITRIVVDEGPNALNPFFTNGSACHWKDGTLKGMLVAQPIIAGYVNGVPNINVVDIYPDWKENKMVAVPITLNPGEGEQVDARFHDFVSVSDVPRTICNAQSEAYKRAEIKFRLQREAFCRKGFARFTLEEASDMLRILIQLESEMHPEWFGFPITVITVPRSGKPFQRSYCRDFPSRPNRLTKKFGCKKDQQQQKQ